MSIITWTVDVRIAHMPRSCMGNYVNVYLLGIADGQTLYRALIGPVNSGRTERSASHKARAEMQARADDMHSLYPDTDHIGWGNLAAAR